MRAGLLIGKSFSCPDLGCCEYIEAGYQEEQRESQTLKQRNAAIRGRVRGRLTRGRSPKR